MEELRLDEDFMQNELDIERLGKFLSDFKNRSLEQRVKCLMKVYEL